jgi:hypothetical protein
MAASRGDGKAEDSTQKARSSSQVMRDYDLKDEATDLIDNKRPDLTRVRNEATDCERGAGLYPGIFLAFTPNSERPDGCWLTAES